MKAAVLFGLLGFCLLALSCRGGGEVEILFFYHTVCPSCEESARMLESASVVRSLNRTYRRATVGIYDLANNQGTDALLEAIDRHQVPQEKQALPLLLVNGVAYSGNGEVTEAIAALQAGRLGSRGRLR